MVHKIAQIADQVSMELKLFVWSLAMFGGITMKAAIRITPMILRLVATVVAMRSM